MSRFSTETRNRLAKIANVGMLVSLVSSLVTFAPMMPVQAASIALLNAQTTLSNPVFSTNISNAPSTSNVTYTFAKSTTTTVTGVDNCTGTHNCLKIQIDLQTSATAVEQQVWNTSMQASDVVITGALANAGFAVYSVAVSDNNADSVNDRLLIRLDCTGAPCQINPETPMVVSIINHPLTNAEVSISNPPAIGTYTTLSQTITVSDATNAYTGSSSYTTLVTLGRPLTVTASVDPILTFSVTATPVEAPIKNEMSNVAPSDADTCNFGTLTPTVAKICAFGLHIATNASNGYSIYVVQDQNMTFNGNAIKQFVDGGNAVAVYPGSAWTAPTDVRLAHLGYWSSDASVFNDAGAAPLWAGIPNIAAAGAAPVTTALVADSTLPETNDYTYALKIESAATLPQGTGYTHHEYFMVVGNF